MTITNYDIYNEGMDKSYLDKIFFLDKIDAVESILDYGCASGDMLKHIHDIDKNLHLYGFDIDKRMIDLANDKYSDIAIFNDNFDKLIDWVKPENTLLNISSVIHEVYSYGTIEDITKFWTRVYKNNFKYIAIRDFSVSKSCSRDTSHNDYTKLLSCCDTFMLNDFESIWGNTTDNKNLIHFLMKYRYIENWLREVNENYFPLSTEELLSNIYTDKYEVIYFNHYVLPYTYQRVKEDFDIEIKDNTHIQLLLKRK